MAAPKAAKTKEPKLTFSVVHALTNIYLVLLFSFFPLFLSKYYSAARRDKFWSFVIITGIMGASIGIVALSNYLTKDNYYNKKLNIHRDPFTYNITDIAFAAFVFISIVSTLTSGRFLHCFIGLSGKESNGRNMGLLMILLLFVCYAVISRFFFNKKFVYYAVFFGITVVSVIAIFNYYKIDVLGIFAKYKSNENVYLNFTSTIGNKNYLSALICVALPFSIGMAVASEDIGMRIIAYASTCIQFMGLIVATSDGGFLGCLAAIGAILIIASRNIRKLTRFMVCLTIMMVGAKLIWLCEILTEGGSKGYTSFSQFFVYSPFVFLIMAAAATAFTVMLFTKAYRENSPITKIPFYAFLSLVCMAVVVFIALTIYYSCIDTETKLSGIMRFFRFDKMWGTHRGYFWINTFEVYGEMNFFEKLFGTGPETFYFGFKPFFSEMTALFNEGSTNAAHNVYLNYLVTHGILGLGAYLTFVVSATVNAFKRSKENPLAFVCAGVILAFSVQDIVNIANPVNMPWFIVFIALSESTKLRANSTKELEASNF